ncbi:MAG TPA: hypothetical protein VGN12_23835 [Pirellulales bacterium]
MPPTDSEPAQDSIREIESRQDEVLQQLELLEQRITALLADYASKPASVKKAA